MACGGKTAIMTEYMSNVLHWDFIEGHDELHANVRDKSGPSEEDKYEYQISGFCSIYVHMGTFFMQKRGRCLLLVVLALQKGKYKTKTQT